MSPTPAGRLPGALKTAAAVVLLIGIGGGAAYVLAGKLAHGTPPAATAPGGSAASATPSPTPCGATPPSPRPVTQPAPSSPPANGPAWVNTPLGVNLRSAPSAGASKVSTLTQGTALTVTGRAVDSSGNRWDSASVGSQSGWVRDDFLVFSAVKPVGGEGFSLMIPQADTWMTQNGITDVSRPDDPTLPFLRIQTSTTDTLGVQFPAHFRSDVPAISDHTALIQVWSYTVLERVTRAPLDACTLASAYSRADGGWPYVTSVLVHAPGRSYSFTFFTSTPADPAVQQVLDSVATA